MFFKLSLRNVGRSFKDYGIYFITLILAVSIFYIFNSLSSQEYLTMVLQGTPLELAKTVEQLIVYLSVFVSFILGFLILYANSFLFKRRKRELGIYLTLGMERGNISGILLVETLVIGILSLGIGIGIGIPLSQVFSVLIFRMLDVYVTGLSFVFSWTVIGRTALYFGIMFLAVIILNIYSVSRYKIISLIHAQKKKQKLGFTSSWISLGIFILGISLLGWAYGIVLSPNGYDYIIRGRYLLPVFFSGIIGTFLLFLSLAGFLMVMIKKCPRMYYRNINLFTLRQLSSRIQTNWISISVICLMISISICSVSVGMALNQYFRDRNEIMTPFDVTMQVPYGESITDFLDLYELDLTQYTDEVYLLNTYHITDFIFPVLLGGDAMWDLLSYRISDVNPILVSQGIEPVELRDDEVLLIIDSNTFTDENLITDRIEVQGEEFRITNILTEGQLKTDYKRINHHVSVVFPDHVNFEDDEDFITKYTTLSFNYQGEFLSQEIIFTGHMREKIEKLHEDMELNDIFITKNTLIQEESTFTIMIIFVSFYLSAIFILASMTVLALQQLIDAVESSERYHILKKIGVDNAMKNKSLLIQIGIYFLLPLVIASLHSVIALSFFNQILIESISKIGRIGYTPLVSSGAAIVFFVYVLYFFATYIQSKRVLGES